MYHFQNFESPILDENMQWTKCLRTIKLPGPRNGPPARKWGPEKGVLLFERLCLFYFAAITRHKSLSNITENPLKRKTCPKKGGMCEEIASVDNMTRTP